MAKKQATPVDEKFEKQDFDLFKSLEAMDKKDYEWFNSLSEEQQRKFVPYMLLHWCSTVSGNKVVSAYYTMSTDQCANKYMFNEYVQKHPELQWLMFCSASPGIGKQFHKWIPHLSEKITRYKEPATVKTVQEYFGKVYKNADDSTLKEVSKQFVEEQNHKHRLAKMFPEMKIGDIETLAMLTSKEEVDQYDRDSGN